MRGGCEISAMAHYFKAAGPVTCVETNFPRDNLVIKLDTASSLVNLLERDAGRLAALARLGFPPESLTSSFMAPVSGPALLVLNLWGELHVPAQRHKRDGYFAHLVLNDFMGWEHGHQGGDLAAWTDCELAAKADSAGLDADQRARLATLAAELRAEFTYNGPIVGEQVQTGLRTIADHIPHGAILALVQPARWNADGTANHRNTEWVRWCTEALAGRPNVLLIDIDEQIHGPGDHAPNMGDHFDRIVYYRVAEDIMAKVTAQPGAALSAAAE